VRCTGTVRRIALLRLLRVKNIRVIFQISNPPGVMKDEFKVRYSRGSGPGGQRKNKVETCVEIIHIPTRFKEICQQTPSRARNYKIAMERLERRIVEHELEQKRQRQNELRIRLMDSATVIRTYNFKRGVVKDHRSGKEAPLKDVLNGKIDLLR
jgi:protein subunit release factor A